MTQGLRCFDSPLADGIRAFVAHKRSLGRRFDADEKLLALLDRYLVEQHVTKLNQISPDVLADFLASRSRHPRSYNRLLGAVRCLFEWLVLHEHIDTIPLRAVPKRTETPLRPFLFEKAQARDLLDAAAQLPDSPTGRMRGDTYEMIFALLYALGLRVSEVTRLRARDLDLQQKLLVIRNTKFSKSRLVPFGPRVAQKLSCYLERREESRGQFDPDDVVFSLSKDGCRPIRPTTISWTFRKLVLKLDFEVPPGVRTPHLHCLRHSFAVATLLRWYREGIDPAQRLLHLSTFLGHVSPQSTAVYLTITDELLRMAGERYARFAAPILEGVGS